MAGKDGKGPAAVLFDVDGTLVDTNYLNAVTWWEAFRQAGHDVPMAVVHRAIGMGSDLMLDKLLPGDRDRGADADIRTSHTALYAVYWSRLRPLPGAADLLRACKKRGLAVVLASSADEREFSMLRSVLDAEDAIDEATFSGEVDASKPAPDLVEVALDKAGVPAEDAVFVGDTVWDAQACRKASVPCIGVLSGGSSRDELTGAGAAEVYPGPAELLAALPQSLLGRLRLVGGSSFFFIRVAGELMLRGWARGRRVAGRAWLIFPVPVSYAPATAQGHWTTPRSPNDTARLRGIGTESGRGT